MNLLGQPAVTRAAAIIATAVLIVAIAFHILCLSTPFYFVLSDGEAKDVYAQINQINVSSLANLTLGIRYGLWKICVDSGNDSYKDQCHQMTSLGPVVAPDWLTAPRTLSILGLLVAAVGVVSLVAHPLMAMQKLPYFFLSSAAGSSILGGIIILSGDIAFAVEKTIKFYADSPQDLTFFNKTDLDSVQIYTVQVYDNRFARGWSFILDLISGAMCIAAGPVFVYVTLRLQWAELVKDKHPQDSVPRSNQMTTRV